MLNQWYAISCATLYLLTAIGLTPGGSNTVHIYTQNYTENTQLNRIPGKEHT